MANLIFIPLILLVGYLLLVRPQQQRARRQQDLLSSIDVGDEVVTAGGIVGRVDALEDDRVWLELSPGNKVQFLRQAISRKVEPSPTPGDDGNDGNTAGTVRNNSSDAASDGTTGHAAGTATGSDEETA